MEIPKYEHDIHSMFLQRLEADKSAGLVQPWMTSWYWKDLYPQFGDSQGYRGPAELVGWIHGQSIARPYHTPADLSFLTQRALFQEDTERRILAHPVFSKDPRVGSIDYANHAVYSAQDFYFQTLCEDSKQPIKSVVDFGSGCGRMAPQWLGLRSSAFVSVDALPQTYCMQHLFYAMLDYKLVDYVVEPAFQVNLAEAAIYHMPSWRMELLPESSIDLVSVVQVLGELRPEMLEYVIDHFKRTLRPGGILYVRDHGARHNPNKVDIPSRIAARGFSLEFVAPYEDLKQLHGIPKIWKKPI